MDRGAWWAAVHGVAKSRARLSDFPFTFYFHGLEKEMAAHSSVLAWRIPGTEEPGGPPSVGSHRVDTTEATRQQQQNPRDGGAWWAAVCGVAQSRQDWSDSEAAGTHCHFARCFLAVFVVPVYSRLLPLSSIVCWWFSSVLCLILIFFPSAHLL